MLIKIKKYNFSHSSKSNIDDLIKNYTPLKSPIRRIQKLLECSVGALLDPTKADLVSQCGDLSSQSTLISIRN